MFELMRSTIDLVHGSSAAFCVCTLGDETALSLQIKRPAASCAELTELDDERNAAREEASSGAELCVEKSPSVVYEEGELPGTEARELCSKKRKLSSFAVSI